MTMSDEDAPGSGEQNQTAIRALVDRAYTEFSDVGDYIWKAPRLIDSEQVLELEKLDSYFPITGDPDRDKQAFSLRAIRWYYESHKLANVFPQLVAVGNLFCCTSLFEAFCLSLCKEIERKTVSRLRDCKGRGITAAFEFIRRSGVVLENVPLRQETIIALKIRNCFIHADGELAWSRDGAELRRIVRSLCYLKPDSREKRRISPRLIELRPGIMGEKLHIENNYSHIANGYLRDHFCSLATAVDNLIST